VTDEIEVEHPNSPPPLFPSDWELLIQKYPLVRKRSCKESEMYVHAEDCIAGMTKTPIGDKLDIILESSIQSLEDVFRVLELHR